MIVPRVIWSMEQTRTRNELEGLIRTRIGDEVEQARIIARLDSFTGTQLESAQLFKTEPGKLAYITEVAGGELTVLLAGDSVI